MAYSTRRFPVAETPTQLNFSSPAHHQRARSYSQTSTPRNRLSFLSLTPSPKSTSFAHLIEPENKGYSPVYIFDQLNSPAAVTGNRIVPASLSKAKSLFTFRLTMPSWSMSSKSSGASKSSKVPRPYIPPPFFNSVAEYQLIFGGKEKAAVAAIIRERGLDMTVEEAYEIFKDETPGCPIILHGRGYRDDVMEYAKLIPGSDDDASSADGESLYYASSFSSSTTANSAARHRSRPVNQYTFEDNFSPNSFSSASYRSSTASSTLYAPSMGSSASSSSSGSSRSSNGIRGIFKLGRK